MAIKRAYRTTDDQILEKAVDLGRGGSTAVTAILIDCQKLIVANVGDSRAVICKNGTAKQLSVDHEPSMERNEIENRGGFVSTFPGIDFPNNNKTQILYYWDKACWFRFLDYLLSYSGDVARVDGQLAVARAFGDKSLKRHLSSEPDITIEIIDEDTEFAILASDGIWKVSLTSSL